MYDSNRFVDLRVYPQECPECNAPNFPELDWETGLGYCDECGFYEEDE